MTNDRVGFTSKKHDGLFLTGIRQGSRLMAIFHNDLNDIPKFYEMFEYYTHDVESCFYVKIPTHDQPHECRPVRGFTRDTHKEVVLYTSKNQSSLNKRFSLSPETFTALDIHQEMNR